jgi:hypothetical protein
LRCIAALFFYADLFTLPSSGPLDPARLEVILSGLPCIILVRLIQRPGLFPAGLIDALVHAVTWSGLVHAAGLVRSGLISPGPPPAVYRISPAPACQKAGM